MPNDATAEKAGSAEHGDDASARCHHDQIPWSLPYQPVAILRLVEIFGPVEADRRAELRRGEIGAVEIGADEDHAGQVGAAELSALEGSVGQVGVLQ